MNTLEGVMAAAAEVEAFCRQRGWRYCFIGGIAVQRWGRNGVEISCRFRAVLTARGTGLAMELPKKPHGSSSVQ